jgi:predicted amidophosphoribosyltransferase
VPGVDATWSAATYDGAARSLVGALKFGSRVALAEAAAALIAGRAPAKILDGTIVPVPPAPLRRRRRGFDSAEAIASALGRRTGLPLAPCLARTQGRRQVGRRRSERLADPPSVRAVSPPPSVAVLVDDVMTTGATASECARVLRRAGASRVSVATVARTLKFASNFTEILPREEGLGSQPLQANEVPLAKAAGR